MLPWLDIIVFLVIAALCAAFGQALAGFSMGGYLVSLLVGFAGAWAGVWLAVQFDWPEMVVVTLNGVAFPLVWALISSLITTLAASLLFQRRVMHRTIEQVTD